MIHTTNSTTRNSDSFFSKSLSYYFTNQLVHYYDSGLYKDVIKNVTCALIQHISILYSERAHFFTL